MNRDRGVHAIAMNSTWKPRLLWLAAIPIAATMLGSASRLAYVAYIGHFVPPSLDPLFDEVSRIERFTEVHPFRSRLTQGQNELLGTPFRSEGSKSDFYFYSGEAAAGVSGPSSIESVGEPPMGRLRFEIARRGFTIENDEPIAIARLEAAAHDLESLPMSRWHDLMHLPIIGEPIAAVEGIDTAGQPFLIATGQHHVSGRLYEYRARRYAIDWAGALVPHRSIEFRFEAYGFDGIAPFEVALLSAGAMLAVWVCFALIVPFLCFVGDRFASTAAPASPNDAP
jgi:hypothetical protein